MLWLIPNQGPLVYNRVTGLACHAHHDNKNRQKQMETNSDDYQLDGTF